MAAELFGSKPLLRSTKDGDTVDAATALAGKVVGIYFSAHWCGPCRHFTPTLVEAYKKIKQTKPFEIVFVSSDKDDQAFEEYYGEMPWLAVDYEHRDIKAALSKKYKVSGIPTLVLVDAQGKTITTGGREVLSEDPTGAEFPWTPKSVFELLGDKLVGPGGAVVDKSALAGKTVGLYFSAHWCGPCRGFTPELVKTYKKIQAAGKPFEIVFVSSDRDEAAFKEYHGEMPWLALPFENRAAKASLSRMFGSGCMRLLRAGGGVWLTCVCAQMWRASRRLLCSTLRARPSPPTRGVPCRPTPTAPTFRGRQSPPATWSRALAR
eukprot:TRINITY_DN49_c0_g1_i2.p2 TRINITY_DN49_c0_g1~~TRINITY_DN49_c0_g1_i2.p2  ORF type:complete len:339 (-),score=79.31 TRINITY_DN49_c0_g1_i2:407-1369(-)